MQKTIKDVDRLELIRKLNDLFIYQRKENEKLLAGTQYCFIEQVKNDVVWDEYWLFGKFIEAIKGCWSWTTLRDKTKRIDEILARFVDCFLNALTLSMAINNEGTFINDFVTEYSRLSEMEMMGVYQVGDNYKIPLNNNDMFGFDGKWMAQTLISIGFRFDDIYNSVMAIA